MTSDDHGERTVTAVGWSAVSQIGRQALSFLFLIVLARLLAPRQFGLMSMIAVFTGLAHLFMDLGLSAAVIQRKELEDRHLSSAFWLNLAAGAAVTGVLALSAPFIADFYGEPILQSMVPALALNFTLGSLSTVHRGRLSRELDFRAISIANIFSILFAGVTGVALASAGLGVWSLVVKSVLDTTISTAVMWRADDWRPAFAFDLSAIKDLSRFSFSLLATQIIGYSARNLDDMLVGRVVGSSALGAYNKAYQVMIFPLQNISGVIARVMFPSLSQIQDDRARVKNLFLRVTRAIALVTFPLMTGLFVTVEPFVLAVFGQDWSQMIPILKILSLLGLVQSITTLQGNLYLSQGRADLQLKVNVVTKIPVFLGIIVGLNWGAVGVATGYTAAELLILYPQYYFAGRLVNLKFRELLVNLTRVFVAAFMMAVVVWGVGRVLPSGLMEWQKLSAQVACGVIVYGLIVHLTSIPAYRDVRNLLSRRIGFLPDI